MSSPSKTAARILAAQSDANIRFKELRTLLLRLGFSERIRGDHHIYARGGVNEIINLQPKGGKAKPYQVRQVRDLMLKYNLLPHHEE